MKKIITFFVAIILIVLAGGLMLMNYYTGSLEAIDSNSSEKIEIVIPEGATTNKIAQILLDNNLIKDVRVFKYYAKDQNIDVKFKAGKFILSKDMNMDKICMTLISSAAAVDITENFMISPGVIAEKAANQLAEQLNLDEEVLMNLISDASQFRDEFEFLKDNPNIEFLQGYLLPNTYNVYKGLSEKEIIAFLLGQFDKWYISVKPITEYTNLDLNDLITLASIIEKEAGSLEEKVLVSSVFYNRLNMDMALQSCATVNYIRGDWKDHLSTEDISVEDPYNTYINKGLPPTPINSPSISSIEAALEPADTDYLYFLAKGDGSSYFSETYEEHLRAKAKYID